MKSKKSILLFLENINFSLTLFNEMFSYVYNAAFTSASKKKQFVKLQYLYEVRAASANTKHGAKYKRNTVIIEIG